MQPMSYFIFLILSFFPLVSSIVTLEVDSTASLSVPTEVRWRRHLTDPRMFDLRFVQDGMDKGLAAQVNSERHKGTTSVVFKDQGLFRLKAIDFNNGDEPIGTSQTVRVVDSSSNTTQTSTGESTTMAPSTSFPTPEGSTPALTTITSQQYSNSPSPIGGSSKHSRVPAIVGGIIGGLACLGILIAVALLLLRHRDNKTIRRLTFHRDLMVQSRSVLADLEHGRNASHTPLPSGLRHPISVPSPIVPTRTQFPVSAIAMPSPNIAPTERQVLLDNRVDELEQRIDRIRRQNRGQAGAEAVIHQIRQQVQWLESQRDSPWARFETNVPPPGLDLYWE